MVVLDIGAASLLADEADVLVINTDSRWCDPHTAYMRAKAAAEVFEKAGTSMVYKKIDSALRGNIGTELDAVMDVFGAEVAFVVPAFPATGRVTIEGRQLLRNIPLDEAEVASDLLSPVTESHVPSLLARQTRRQVGHVSIDQVISGSRVLAETFSTKLRSGDQIIVVDAFNQAHLGTIASTIASLEYRAVVAGSAGLAGEFPRKLRIACRSDDSTVTSDLGGVLVISGSASSTTRVQLEYAEAAERLPVILIDAGSILRGLDRDQAGTRRIVEQAWSNLSQGRDIIIALGPSVGHGKHGSDDRSQSHRNTEDSHRITAYLGLLAGKILSACMVAGFVLTGGDTALAVCREIGGIGVAMLDEIAPGMPSGRIVGGAHAGLMVVTKAGSFGGDDAIVEAVRYLRTNARERYTGTEGKSCPCRGHRPLPGGDGANA